MEMHRPGARTFVIGTICALAVIGRAVLFLPDAEFVTVLPQLWTIIAGFGGAYGASKVATGLRARYQGQGVAATLRKEGGPRHRLRPVSVSRS